MKLKIPPAKLLDNAVHIIILSSITLLIIQDEFMRVLTILLFAGVIQGLFLSAALVTIGKNNRRANRILAAIILIFSLSILIHAADHSEILFRIPYHPELMQLMFFLLGPLIFNYVRTLTDPDFKKSSLLHYIPFAFATAVFIPLYISAVRYDPEVSLRYLDDTGFYISCIVTVSIAIYMFLSIKRLNKHSVDIQQNFSNIDKINLRWLKVLLGGITVTMLAAVFVETLFINKDSWDAVWLLVALLIFAIGYFGLRQPLIFSGIESSESTEKLKYEKSTLTSDLKKEYLERLLNFMETDKPYLDSNITLNNLAVKLSISLHHLSQVINEELNMNFFEYINRARIDEAKRLLHDPQKQNIMISEIGLEAGFNSVSSFNTAFKKYTGMTPSSFKSGLQSESG